MARNFLDAVIHRRSYYSLSKQEVVPLDEVEQIIRLAVKNSPTAFNSQSGRVVLLANQYHDQLWNIVMEALENKLDEKRMLKTRAKIECFKSAYATLLFYEDQSVVSNLQSEFPSYADNFAKWSQQSSGMLQFILWTALEDIGYGASLQHYNELIEKQLQMHFEIPAQWSLISQMPFGKPVMDPCDKEFLPLDTRIKILK